MEQPDCGHIIGDRARAFEAQREVCGVHTHRIRCGVDVTEAVVLAEHNVGLELGFMVLLRARAERLAPVVLGCACELLQ